MYDLEDQINLKSKHVKKREECLQMICSLHFICKQKNGIEKFKGEQFAW